MVKAPCNEIEKSQLQALANFSETLNQFCKTLSVLHLTVLLIWQVLRSVAVIGNNSIPVLDALISVI
jgi:hypothetical protein